MLGLSTNGQYHEVLQHTNLDRESIDSAATYENANEHGSISDAQFAWRPGGNTGLQLLEVQF